MKLWKPTLISVLSALTLFNAHAEPKQLDSVAVIVNSGVILQSDVDSALKTIKANAKQNKQPLPQETVLREQVLEKLIIDTLQQQEADRIGVKIDDNRLNEAIKEIAKNNQQTQEQLIASVAQEGLTYPEFREQVRKEMAASDARNALVRRRINILPAEVDTLAELLAQETDATVQYKISHIQLRVDDGQDKSAAETLANKLVNDLKNGADFAQMAYAYSKGPKALQGEIGDGCAKKRCQPSLLIRSKCRTKAALLARFAVVSVFTF